MTYKLPLRKEIVDFGRDYVPAYESIQLSGSLTSLRPTVQVPLQYWPNLPATLQFDLFVADKTVQIEEEQRQHSVITGVPRPTHQVTRAGSLEFQSLLDLLHVAEHLKLSF